MKKILGLLLTFVMTFTFAFSVNAIDKSVTFTKSDYLSDYRNILYSYAGTTYKEAKTNSGQVFKAYCFNHAIDAPKVKTKLYHRALSKIEAQYEDAFVYILENGYGGSWNSKVIGTEFNYTNSEKYYITQLAIWILQEEIGLDGVPYSSLGTLSNTGVRKTRYRDAARRLVDAAKKHKQVDPKIGITGQGNMTLSKDKNYFQSGTMTVTGTGYNSYKVNLVNPPKGAEIVTVGDNKVKKNGSSLNAGTKFYVRVPKNNVTSSLSMKVEISASATKKSLAIYEDTTSNNTQDVGVLFKEPKSVKTSIKLSASPKGHLKVRKVAIDAAGNESDLKDVKITVKNSSGAVIGTWTTTDTNNPKIFNNLPIGVYTIIEESAPEGYTKSSDIKVTIKAGETYEVKLQNFKGRQPVEISKQDITTGTELPGAKLVLKDSMGNVIEEWTSGNSPHIIKKELTPGMTYKLSEEIAPKGYQKTTEVITFKVNNDGGVDSRVVMYNTPITNVKISKQDISTGKELPGAHLMVKDANGKIIDEWVSTTTPHYLPQNLEDGEYTLIETIAPKGYGISEEVIKFTVKNNGVAQTVVMTNSPIPETADNISFPTIVGILVLTTVAAGFGIFKLNKQDA